MSQVLRDRFETGAQQRLSRIVLQLLWERRGPGPQRLAKVNHWTPPRVENHLAAVFADCRASPWIVT